MHMYARWIDGCQIWTGCKPRGCMRLLCRVNRSRNGRAAPRLDLDMHHEVLGVGSLTQGACLAARDRTDDEPRHLMGRAAWVVAPTMRRGGAGSGPMQPLAQTWGRWWAGARHADAVSLSCEHVVVVAVVYLMEAFFARQLSIIWWHVGLGDGTSVT